MNTFEEILTIIEYCMDNILDDEAEQEFFNVLNGCYGHYLI